MKRMPSITISIPVYNEEKNIANCLDSIKKQKYSGKIEVFVVDNGCIDGTIEIARKYKFVKIIKNKENDYLTAKMISLKRASGKYYTYLDADIDLPTSYWIKKMVEPLENDKTLIASTTGFVSYKSDPLLNKYLTLDPIQRDPLFVYLTPSVESLITEKRNGYDLMIFNKNNILSMGLCVFRTKQILSIDEISKRKRFYELDNLVILLNKGFDKYAYVKSAGLHHLTVPDIKTMIDKRVRNLKKTFFVKNEKRYWTWIDTSDKKSIFKLALWVLYSETIIGPLFYGIFRSIKHRTILGLYEPIVVWITTNVIMYVFLTSQGGRKFLANFIK